MAIIVTVCSDSCMYAMNAEETEFDFDGTLTTPW